MLEVVLTMFVVLFAFLAGGLWIGWTLAVTGTVLLAIFRDIPLDKLLAAVHLEHPDHARNCWPCRCSSSWARSCSGPVCRDSCSGPVPVGGDAAGAPAARERHRLHDLRRHLGLVGGDDPGGRPHLADGAAEARLFARTSPMGSLAGAGTLGFLIPPSNIMIIYGVLGDVSIAQAVHGRLHSRPPAGGLLHGLDHDPHCADSPELVPEIERARCGSPPRREFLRRSSELGPAVFLILCVLGSMYGGLATPSEAAAVGVLGALIVGLVQRELSIPAMKRDRHRFGADLQP
jgi:C4-dicarboxylate transporter DctM subunit